MERLRDHDVWNPALRRNAHRRGKLEAIEAIRELCVFRLNRIIQGRQVFRIWGLPRPVALPERAGQDQAVRQSGHHKASKLLPLQAKPGNFRCIRGKRDHHDLARLDPNGAKILQPQNPREKPIRLGENGVPVTERATTPDLASSMRLCQATEGCQCPEAEHYYKGVRLRGIYYRPENKTRGPGICPTTASRLFGFQWIPFEKKITCTCNPV